MDKEDSVDKNSRGWPSREFAHGASPHQSDEMDELRRQVHLATVRILELEKTIHDFQGNVGGSSGANADVDEHFTVIVRYRLREICATDAAALYVFYNEALGAGSKAFFQPLG